MPTSEQRRRARRAYKEALQPAGVFELRNRANGKILVGKSPNLPAMKNRLFMQLQTGSYSMHPELQSDWRKHGSDQFEYRVLEQHESEDHTAPSADDLQAMLDLWIEDLQPFGERGYHRRPQQ